MRCVYTKKSSSTEEGGFQLNKYQGEWTTENKTGRMALSEETDWLNRRILAAPAAAGDAHLLLTHHITKYIREKSDTCIRCGEVETPSPPSQTP